MLNLLLSYLLPSRLLSDLLNCPLHLHLHLYLYLLRHSLALAFPLLPQPAIIPAAIIPVNNIHITFFFIFLILSFSDLQGVRPAVFFSFPFDSFYFTALM